MLAKTLAPSTYTQYQRAFKEFIDFSRDNNLRALPLHEHNLMLYTTNLATRSQYSNIKVHLSAIKHYAIALAYHTELPPFNRLYLLTRAIKRRSTKKQKRTPITVELLNIIYNNVNLNGTYQQNATMYWAACTCAFFGFLRSAEFVAPYTTRYDAENTLLVEDVSTVGGRLHINIKSSKTDPFHHGSVIRLSHLNSFLCPVTAMRKHLQKHPTGTGPLFTLSDKTYLTRRRLNTFLKDLLQSNINGPTSSHSFRIGAATAAANGGCPRWLIQQLGRWNSDSFRTYLRTPDSTIDAVSNIISVVRPIVTQYDPDLC